MRKELAFKSSLIGLLSKITGIIISFFISRYFTLYFGLELRGIQNIYTNILGFLNLAEFGIGAAITYSLYQPIVEQNYEEIKSIMNLFKKLYAVIFAIISAGGFLIIPLVFFFIGKTEFSVKYILITYLLSLFTASSTYLLAYKRNLLYADQKQYIMVCIDALINILCGIAKIISILFIKSFIVFLLISLFQNIISNVIINIYCNKHYLYLKDKNVKEYANKKELFSNIKNIFVGRISSWVYCSTDNLIISKFVNLVMVGIMSNYYVLKSALNTIMFAIASPVQPILVNYIRKEKDVGKLFNIFCTYSFITYSLANICFTGFIFLGNDIVSLWIGKDYTVSVAIVIFLALDLFISIIHEPLVEFIQILGLFKDDRNMSLTGMLINLITSIILVIPFGVLGVLMGTVIAQIYYWSKRAVIIFKNYFTHCAKLYIFLICKYIISIIIEVIVLFFIFSVIAIENELLSLMVKGVICVFISFVTIIIPNIKSKELKETMEILRHEK